MLSRKFFYSFYPSVPEILADRLPVCPRHYNFANRLTALMKYFKNTFGALMLSDFSCIFAMSVCQNYVELDLTNLGEISDIIKPW